MSRSNARPISPTVRIATTVSAVVAVTVLLLATPAEAWVHSGETFFGTSWAGDGSHSITSSPSTSHEGLAVANRYLTGGVWYETSYAYGYGSSVSQSVTWVTPDDCAGRHRMKVSGQWSPIQASDC